MYDIAKKARAGMKAKAERLAGEKDRKTDSSDWTPAPELNADVKTGMRPVSRRAYKKGGAVKGDMPKQRADRAPRKAGGKVETKGEQPLVDRYINRDLKKANEYRDGKKHVGALKSGGRAKYGTGGGPKVNWEQAEENYRPTKRDPNYKPADLSEGSEQITKMINAQRSRQEAQRKHGGRTKKEDGGSIDPRLGIVSPKALNFAQNLVTPGLKRGGRTKKEVGGAARAAGAAATPSLAPVNVTTSAPNIPPVSSGLLPQPKGTYEKPPAYDPKKYNKEGSAILGKLGFSPEAQDILKGFKNPTSAKKGGRIAKADGGSMRQRFNAEFAKQRAAGAKKFTFEGKEYTTELAKPNKSPMGSGPGSSRAGAPPMGAGPGSRSANVAAPAEAGPGSANPRSYTPTRVMGGGQGATNRATPSVTTGTPPRDERYYEDSAPVTMGSSLGNKRGGRIKKQIGGALGSAAGALGRSMAPATMGAAMRPQMPSQAMMGRPPMGANPAMMGRGPAPQAMANAQGRPFQPGGKFATQPAPMPAPGTPGGPPITNFPMPMQPQPAPTPAPQPMPVRGLYDAAPPALGTVQQPPMAYLGGNPNFDESAPVALSMPGTTYATGGRIARAFGGEINNKSKSKSSKSGKSNINIIISTGKAEKPQMPPAAATGPGMPPLPPPAPMMGAGAPPPMGGPGMPPMGPPPGPMMPPPPMPRKAGGRVSKVARSFKDMTAGAGSGEGRLQKTDIAKRAPHKAGGKVYRSYKDMDAGAGSGKGRMEKTEIQSRKK